MALSLVRRGLPQAVLCELGDGAVNMGAWHESLNLAAVWNLPVVFLVINNQYGMGTSVERASAEPDLFKRAGSYRMTGERVDGDDLEAVIEATSRLLTAAREERKPAVLEALTYRYRGHSVADAGLAYRTKEEIEERKLADPLERVKAILRDRGVEEGQIEAADAAAEEAVERSVAFAEADPAPDVDRLAAGMYAPGAGEQFERMVPGSPIGERELVFSGGLGA
jgi:pyruvate dehydrogenase E1 component alpha subunit